ncbi:efflux RND transporter permease subunit [Acetobacter orleanensis]|uniref:Cation efflux system protein n=1 Tax=Acetobacter orleanensis TaxID=104099 RepID=A0A4Y3TKP7_9PROT|nr:efflux RND transporter permease subunit [Acetobacter orleanensis]KXV65763.1 cobalt transporter [Acetobacter orleanensis]PCD78659.1 AcrB/AcrD/AcrF family protein [Acetobacter orleanensis]GAN67302.1 acriflavin resistance protein/heavy metal efflux pump CzcA [Acetobacter orleanensis JCM 7639]GBR23874.1 cobalt/zinc/cadmium resistance heavy metal efflux pump protein CzcA [Acetobacter orleanensis NRIC 0473]GEB83561.1 cation efflux system protein [Acetobacter orleanensis]
MSAFNLSRWAVRHTAFMIFLLVLVFLAGSDAFLHLGRAEDPSFTLKEMLVASQWNGATPDQMRLQVAKPLAVVLRTIDHLDYLETYCLPGACLTRVVLMDDTPRKEVAAIWSQVRHRLDDTRPTLPEGASVAANDDFADVYGYVFMLTGAENTALVRTAERLRDILQRLPGVRKVDIGGEEQSRIAVSVDPGKLAAIGIGLSDLRENLSAALKMTPMASMEQTVSLPVIISGLPDGVATVADTQLPLADGPVRIGDIARVTRDYVWPPFALTRFESKPAVTLSVSMSRGADGLTLGKAISQTVSSFRADLPVGFDITQIEDQSVYIREAVDTFLLKFCVALVVVLGVAVLSMGVRPGIVVALSVPATLAMVALVMNIFGINLDRISLGALILALGLLVDDAIISVEAMVVRLEAGASREEAAAYAWDHTAFPMLSGTLLTVAGFLPVGLAQTTTSEYAGNVFWVTGTALICSWFVAVLFIPCLGVKLLPADFAQGRREPPYQSRSYRFLRKIITWATMRSWLVAVSTLGVLGLSVAGFVLVRQQFFPLSDRPEFLVDIMLPPASTIERTSVITARIEKRLAGDPDAASYQSFIGQGPPRFYLPYGPTLPDPTRATILVVGTSLDARERLIARMEALRVMPEAEIDVRRLSLGPSAAFPVLYRVLGPDPAVLSSISEKLEDTLEKIPVSRSVGVDWGLRAPAISFQSDRLKTARLGLNHHALGQQVSTLLSGAVAGEVLDNDKRVQVMVQADMATRTDPSRLNTMPIQTRAGFVPLNALGRVQVASTYPVEWLRNDEACMTVHASPIDGASPSDVTTAMNASMKTLRQTLPEGYRIESDGDDKMSQTANEAIYGLLPLSLVLMLILLMGMLQDIRRVAFVLVTAPMGLIGTVIALLITRAPFGFVALLGMIALAGMIMRNAIILVDQIRRNEIAGMDYRHAVVEATVTRVRPVLLTALAAVFAFIPLSFNVFWGPMAIVMIGGLAGATVLTLFSLPAFCMVGRARQKSLSSGEHHAA